MRSGFASDLSILFNAKTITIDVKVQNSIAHHCCIIVFIAEIFKVLQKFWPGELTIVFNAKRDFVDIFDDEMETIGIRIPKNETALEIIKNVGGIVLTTSANISGENGVSDIKDINEELLKKVDFVIKEEHELTGVPSTIIKYEGGKISLLREGRITLDDIEKLID